MHVSCTHTFTTYYYTFFCPTKGTFTRCAPVTITTATTATIKTVTPLCGFLIGQFETPTSTVASHDKSIQELYSGIMDVHSVM